MAVSPQSVEEGTRYMELVEDEALGLRLLRPRDPEALISEEEFAHDEFLPYWAELWPSALALAEEVERRVIRGLRVVELGCGLAVPSLVAARGGARVLATDWAADAVALARTNAERNHLSLEVALIDWRQPDELVGRGPFDLVLAADVLYEGRYVDVLLELLPQLGGEVLLADPGRPFLRSFLEQTDAERVADRIYMLKRSP